MPIKVKSYDLEWDKYFDYDESCPSCLRWKINVWAGKNKNILKVKAGSPAGSKMQNGYFCICIQGERYYSHRVIFKMFYPDIELKFVDHGNGIRSDNRYWNLLSKSVGENNRNCSARVDNLSGITGVNSNTVVSPSGVEYKYYNAECHLNGSRFRKQFSVFTLGEQEAFRLACEYRAKMIEELNQQGAGYTERHGT